MLAGHEGKDSTSCVTFPAPRGLLLNITSPFKGSRLRESVAGVAGGEPVAAEGTLVTG